MAIFVSMCAAPAGNQFWKQRTTHGRKRIFEKPPQLLKACYEYFEWCDNNPLHKLEQLKSPGKPYRDENGKMVQPEQTIQLAVLRPYTIHGLCIHLGVNTKYFNDFKKGCNDDFSEVITHVEDIIYTQKFEGAAAGLLVPNIIARDLGLADKKDITTQGDKITESIDYTKLSESALKEIAALRSDQG